MRKYRESNLIRAGILGAVLILLIIAIGLQPEPERRSAAAATAPSTLPGTATMARRAGHGTTEPAQRPTLIGDV